MSSDPFWMPPPQRREEQQLPRELKYILGRELWGHYGTCRGEPTEMGKEWVPFLNGVVAAGDDEMKAGAKALLAAIQKHGSVIVRIGEYGEESHE